IVIKINHPAALFNGLIEFWPWDVIWDGAGGVFRRVRAQPSPTSYGHLAVKVSASAKDIIAELQRKDIAFRTEPRAPGFSVLAIDEPEGNMIELFPNVDHMSVLPEAIVPRDRAAKAIAEMRRDFAKAAAGIPPDAGYPLIQPARVR